MSQTNPRAVLKAFHSEGSGVCGKQVRTDKSRLPEQPPLAYDAATAVLEVGRSRVASLLYRWI